MLKAENLVFYLLPFTLYLLPFTLHPSPFTLYPSPFTLHPSPFTLHPSPFTLHPFLSIHFSQHNVNGPDTRHDIGDQSPFDQSRQSLQIRERGRADVAAEGFRRAIADNVEAQFATRRFNGLVDLAHRRMESLGYNLKVIN